MAFDFSALVTDRTLEDVTAWTSKGTYNTADLNRVGAAVEYIAAQLTAYGYIVPVEVRTDWAEADVPTASQMEAYRQSIATLRAAIAVMASTPETPERMARLNYVRANNIEQILMDLERLITNMTRAWFFSGDLYAGEA